MKLKSKLELAGINPAEIGGYRLYDMEPGKDKLINKVLDMQGNRDKKVAHGRTPKRGIGYCELKDKQALSRHIILSHIELKLKNQSSNTFKYNRSGSGWIRTSDQGLMSPLLCH